VFLLNVIVYTVPCSGPESDKYHSNIFPERLRKNELRTNCLWTRFKPGTQCDGILPTGPNKYKNSDATVDFYLLNALIIFTLQVSAEFGCHLQP
jgi:hypothetical protein